MYQTSKTRENARRERSNETKLRKTFLRMLRQGKTVLVLGVGGDVEIPSRPACRHGLPCLIRIHRNLLPSEQAGRTFLCSVYTPNSLLISIDTAIKCLNQ